MKRGSGKNKGSGWERTVCTKLSLWVTNGQQKDCFWRSAMSGGRATQRHRKGEQVKTQQGDITAVDRAGHPLTDRFYIECKSYKDLSISSFILTNTGILANFWKNTQEEASKYMKIPMLIAKQNYVKPIVILPSPCYFVDLLYQAKLSPPQSCTLALFDHLLMTRFYSMSRTK